MGLTEEQEQKLKELVHKNKSEMDDGEITHRVKLALQRKYQRPEWGLFFEVTGKNGKRADAIAYNLYPSRNFKALGFEIKASRNDWQKELQDISKADWFVGQCDEWYVVAGRKGIVRKSELPEGWGLLEMKGGGKLYKVVESELTEHQDRPIDKEFWARGMQKAMKKVKSVKRQRNRVEREAYRRGKKEGKEEGDISNEQKILIEKGEKFDVIAENLDIHISRFVENEEVVEKVNKAVKVVEKIDEDEYGNLVSKVSHFRKDYNRIEEYIDSLEEYLKELGAEIETKPENGLMKFQCGGDKANEPEQRGGT